MKNLAIFGVVFALAFAVFVPAGQVSAATNYTVYTPGYSTGSVSGSQEELISYLLKLIAQLQAEIQARNYGYNYDNNYGYNYNNGIGNYKNSYVIGNPRSNHSGDDQPDVETDRATNIDDNEAELRGSVDMNDFDDGEVFFVYGEDESQIEDVEDDFDSYNDVDEDGDDLQKISVDSSLDGDEDYRRRITGLDKDTDYYYQICVAYEDEDNDDVIECGGVEDFTTDRNGNSDNNNDDEPDVTTQSATNIDDDSARIRGEVDMNDFENGVVFFVYGEDESQIEDVEDDYDTYSEVDEDGRDLQKYRVDTDLDSSSSYYVNINGLDNNTDYYFQICVEYEDEDNDEVLMCGGVEDFETDN